MATDLDLVNQGLTLVGQGRISSLDNPNGSQTIETANFFLDRVKRAVLRAHDWNCARARDTFTAVDNGSLGEWTYAFRIPPDCLAVRRFASPDADVAYAKFSVENDSELKPVLYTNDGSSSVVFTRNLTDVNRWDTLLFDAAATRLAIEFAAVFPRDMKFVDMMWKVYQAKIEEAAGINEAEGGQERVYSQSLTDVR